MVVLPQQRPLLKTGEGAVVVKTCVLQAEQGLAGL